MKVSAGVRAEGNPENTRIKFEVNREKNVTNARTWFKRPRKP